MRAITLALGVVAADPVYWCAEGYDYNNCHESGSTTWHTSSATTREQMKALCMGWSSSPPEQFFGEGRCADRPDVYTRVEGSYCRGTNWQSLGGTEFLSIAQCQASCDARADCDAFDL